MNSIIASLANTVSGWPLLNAPRQLKNLPGKYNQIARANATALRRPRIVFIGPVLPYRGGIANHTTLTCKALREFADVEMISFHRQYPRWLFPGASDREPGLQDCRQDNVRYVLDPVNPLSWHRAVTIAQQYNPDLLVMPWWTVFWAPSWAYIAGRVRRSGVPVLYICHNTFDHEAARWKQAISLRALRQAAGYLVHVKSEEKKLQQLYPERPVLRHLHPTYDHYPHSSSPQIQRGRLELLFFGLVRRYKGLDRLIEALGLLNDPEVFLTIAGEFWGDLNASICRRIRELGLQQRIEVVDRYVPSDEVGKYFGRADAVVLPYTHATGSGVLATAYHFDKPVLVTNVGGLPDAVRDGETGWVVPPDDPRALADTIQRMQRQDCVAMAPAIKALAATMTWRSLAKTILAATTILAPNK